MTVIKYKEYGETFYFSATGHAAYAQPGEADIVCAGLSALTCLLAELVRRAEAEGQLEGRAEILLEPGSARVTCTPLPPFYTALQNRIEVVITGFEMLAEKYADFIRIDAGKNVIA